MSSLTNSLLKHGETDMLGCAKLIGRMDLAVTPPPSAFAQATVDVVGKGSS